MPSKVRLPCDTYNRCCGSLPADKRTRVAVVLGIVPSTVQDNLDREGRKNLP